ncbi:4-hydroxy-tetrahydrodipicolinate reductase [Holzapfeliella sp. He02]|uniref:4-hydroxy-tetrahydrodipicolinate reductase n=1 Tax=Holzapfeliella saturejae TaxID=3082953 RepID=A0ABU8SFX0_9LACO
MIKVVVAGFTGEMGQNTVKMVQNTSDFELVGVFAPSAKGKSAADYDLPETTSVYGELQAIDCEADVWIDFTLPDFVYQNVAYAIEQGMRPVVGTTGLTAEQITKLNELIQTNGLGGLIAPNFGMSAVLLMKFAREAAAYFPDAEIIEMHHPNKKDAPSGTAIKTAEMISQVRQPHTQGAEQEKETLPGSRGGDYEGMKIHSVRLPGYVAHEQVLFGAPGEALTIRQDSFDRQSFMTGVRLAVKEVMNLTELTVGLENIL